jgi:hypothetical protein
VLSAERLKKDYAMADLAAAGSAVGGGGGKWRSLCGAGFFNFDNLS